MSLRNETAGAPPSYRRLSTVAQFSQNHHDLTESAIRWLIHQAKPRDRAKSLTEPNGFDMVIVRRGRRVLLDEDQYSVWLENQQVETTSVAADCGN